MVLGPSYISVNYLVFFLLSIWFNFIKFWELQYIVKFLEVNHMIMAFYWSFVKWMYMELVKYVIIY
jgi:uncharacterized membrane protein